MMTAQKQRSETTRLKLLKAFRSLVLDRGVEGATTQAALEETGLSKGALYHHFQSKSEIIEAIYEEESRGAIERAAKSIDPTAPPLERLRETCIAWMHEVRAPQTAKILFEIGPSALGVHRAKAIEDGFSLKLFEDLLNEAKTAGEIKLENPALTAVMLNALVAEAALYRVRTGADSTDALAGALEAVLASLRID